MVYSAKLNGETFFSTRIDSEEYLLSSAEVKKEAGVSGSFKFVIPPKHRFYNSFHKLTDYVDVYRDDEIIFSGRVYSITEKFDTQLTIECESMLAVLNDSVLRPTLYNYTTARAVFRAIIANHNSQVEDSKKLIVDRITVDDDACYRDYQKIETTLKRINDLSESYGGRVEVKRKSDGYLYIDWLKNFGDGCDQLIDFGSNILDISKSEDASSIITVLIPSGAKGSDGKEIDIKSVNGGLDYVTADQNYLTQYGYIYGTKNWKDVTQPSNLKTKAQQYVNSCCVPQLLIKVKAVDLANAGLAEDNFDVGQKLKVRAVYHGLDGGDSCWFECNKITINLLNPTDNKLELGATTKGYVQSKKTASEEQKTAIDEIIASYASKTDVENAIETATEEIKAGITGRVIEHDSNGDGQPDEILILDTSDINTAVNVWRFNSGGLGHSSTGYNGTYDLALTMDDAIVANYVTSQGLSAEIIKAGVLSAQQGDTYWNLNTGEFHFGSEITSDKSKVFSDTPTTPYYVGDLYATGRVTTTAVAGLAIAGQAIVDKDGTYGLGGDILICTYARQDGAYHAEDWALVTNYIDDSEVESIKGRLATAEVNITTNANGIASKVSMTDYNGATIASLINQSPSTIYIQAEHINLAGTVSLNDVIKFDDAGAYTDNLTIKAMTPSTYTYTSSDVTRIRNIIMGSVSPTSADYAKYDLDNSGHITAMDYIRIKKCVENYSGVYNSTIQIEPGDIKESIKISDNVGFKTSIGAGVVSTNYLNVSSGMYDGNGKALGYVDEYDTTTKNGITWYYRKWHNGFYECWTSIKKTNFAMTTAWGYMYYGTIGAYEYPVEFINTPNVQTSIYWGSTGWILSAKNNTATTRTTPTYYAVCPTYSTQDVGITISASGYVRQEDI